MGYFVYSCGTSSRNSGSTIKPILKISYNRILMIPKHLPLTINKYNTTAVSAASKAQINITKSKILLSKWMFPASMKKRFKPIVVID